MKLIVLLACALLLINIVFPKVFAPVRSALSLNKETQLTERKVSKEMPWTEVSSRDFDVKVLRSHLPARVYFDTAIGCRDADIVFWKLRRQRQGKLNLFYVDADESRTLARTYHVGEEVKLVLFKDGRAVRSTEAKDLIERITTGGHFDGTTEQFFDAFLWEIVGFVD